MKERKHTSKKAFFLAVNALASDPQRYIRLCAEDCTAELSKEVGLHINSSTLQEIFEVAEMPFNLPRKGSGSTKGLTKRDRTLAKAIVRTLLQNGFSEETIDTRLLQIAEYGAWRN